MCTVPFDDPEQAKKIGIRHQQLELDDFLLFSMNQIKLKTMHTQAIDIPFGTQRTDSYKLINKYTQLHIVVQSIRPIKIKIIVHSLLSFWFWFWFWFWLYQ